MMKKVFLLVMLLVIIQQVSIAQKTKRSKKVIFSGIVKDLNEQPIPNAIVKIDELEIFKLTDENGCFSFKVDTSKINKIQVITSKHPVFEYNYSGEEYLSFKFPFANLTGEEKMVDLGYKDAQESSLSYKTTVINSKEINTDRYQTVSQMILQKTPRPLLNRNMLVVLNGVPVEGGVSALNHSLSPKQIKSISVLKSAAAGIYGMKGFFGAIVVKTN